MTNRIEIARIVGVHGIRGLVKLRTDGESLPELADAGRLIDAQGRPVALTLKSMLRGNWLASVAGVADRTAAEALIGRALYATREDLPETDEGEVYVTDLIGLAVIDSAGRRWGTVEGVENYGAGDLLVLRLHGGGEEMLPFADAFVPEYDIEAGTVTILPPDDWQPPA